MSFNLGWIINPEKTLDVAKMGQVVILGVGIVFLGLVCIVAICSIMSAIIKHTEEGKAKVEDAKTITPVQTASEPIANKQELLAVVSAAIAEQMGTDVEAIRIKSIKRI